MIYNPSNFTVSEFKKHISDAFKNYSPYPKDLYFGRYVYTCNNADEELDAMKHWAENHDKMELEHQEYLNKIKNEKTTIR